MGEYLQQFARETPVRRAGHRDTNTVARHHAGHLAGRQEDTLFHALDPHKAEARTVGTDHALADALRPRRTAGLARAVAATAAAELAGFGGGLGWR